jgi:hypothetical protein
LASRKTFLIFLDLGIDLLHATIYNVSCNKKGDDCSTDKSRADYFKERRKNTKAFNVEIEREKMEKFENKLSEQNKSKKKWLDEKIDEELK